VAVGWKGEAGAMGGNSSSRQPASLGAALEVTLEATHSRRERRLADAAGDELLRLSQVYLLHDMLHDT